MAGTLPQDRTVFSGLSNREVDVPDDHTCDCADIGTPACRGKNPFIGFQPFRVLRTAEPEFSEEARKKKVSGNVIIAAVVDVDGRTNGLWVLGPLGLGLDPKAAQAVRQYTFQPATCHDQPVRSTFRVEVNFQIF